MRIERLEASRHKAGRVLIFLEDGTLLKGSEREVLDFSLWAGDELDDETRERLAVLLTAADYASAELPADGNGTLLVFVIGQS